MGTLCNLLRTFLSVGNMRGNLWYWFCDTGVPCIVTLVSMLYFVVFPYNFHKRERGLMTLLKFQFIYNFPRPGAY